MLDDIFSNSVLLNTYSKLCEKYDKSKIDNIINELIGLKPVQLQPQLNYGVNKLESTSMIETQTPHQLVLNLKSALIHLDLFDFNISRLKSPEGPWLYNEIMSRVYESDKSDYFDYRGNLWKIKPAIETYVKIPITTEFPLNILKPFSDSYYIALNVTLKAGLFYISKLIVPLAEAVIIEPLIVHSFYGLQPTIPEIILAAKSMSKYFKSNILPELKYDGDTADEVKENLSKNSRNILEYCKAFNNTIIQNRELYRSQYAIINALPSEIQLYLHFNTNKINPQRLEYLETPITALGKGYLGLKKAVIENPSDFHLNFILYSLLQTEDKVNKLISKVFRDDLDSRLRFAMYFTSNNISDIKLSNDSRNNYKLGQILLKYPELVDFPNHKYLIDAADEIGLNSEYALREYALKLMYANLDIRNNFEMQLFEMAQTYGYSMKIIDDITNAYRLKKDESYLPDINITHDKYEFKKMSVDDVRTYFAGEFSDCCYTFDSAAKTCIKHSITNPNSDTYELIDVNTNDVILNMWIYVTDNDIVVIDSVESQYDEIDQELLFEIFTEFINQIKDSEFNDIRIAATTYGITPKVVSILENMFDLEFTESIKYLPESDNVRYYDSKYGQYIITKKEHIDV